MARTDLVIVFHNDTNHRQHLDLIAAVRAHEPTGGYRVLAVDNRTINRGFARACNLGAFHPQADAPIIGFLNPDLIVDGPFLDAVAEALDDQTVITGCRFGKAASELRLWGVAEWVCGAAMFVSRRWFTQAGGFDEQFTWGWEETDLIRQAERQGLTCRPTDLPFRHASPAIDTEIDAQYKRRHFDLGSRRFQAKWGRR